VKSEEIFTIFEGLNKCISERKWLSLEKFQWRFFLAGKKCILPNKEVFIHK